MAMEVESEDTTYRCNALVKDQDKVHCVEKTVTIPYLDSVDVEGSGELVADGKSFQCDDIRLSDRRGDPGVVCEQQPGDRVSFFHWKDVHHIW